MPKEMIHAEQLVYEYDKRDEEGNIIGSERAIDGIDIDVPQGSFVAILGHNGSGKSTLAKHMNAILVPTGGTMWVDGKDTRDPDELWNIRQSAGMVFQNPDNQIIGTVVEEDVGFGPENLGVPTDEIWKRVEDSLRSVGMLEYRKAFAKQTVRRAEAAGCHCRSYCHGTKVHRTGRTHCHAGSEWKKRSDPMRCRSCRKEKACDRDSDHTLYGRSR